MHCKFEQVNDWHRLFKVSWMSCKIPSNLWMISVVICERRAGDSSLLMWNAAKTNTSLSSAVLAWKQAKSFHRWYVACSFWSSVLHCWAADNVCGCEGDCECHEIHQAASFFFFLFRMQRKWVSYRQISQHWFLTFINAYYSLSTW